MKMKYWTLTALLGLASAAFAAESDSVSGVVTNVNVDAQTVTIRNDDNGRRRVYFLANDTRLTAQGAPITLQDVKRGNAVTVRYRATDAGREIVGARMPSPDDIKTIIPIEISEELAISGRVTGVRPSKRTITIRDDATRERRTLIVPEETRISRAGSPIALSSIKRGDDLTARYRMTERGAILVTARSPKPAAVASAPVDELPTTAGHIFVYLLLSAGLLIGAGLTRMIRVRQS